MFSWNESEMLLLPFIQHPLVLLLMSLLFLLLLGYAVYILLACTRLREVVCPGSMRGRRVLVAVAHPDDECMFFGPTIVSLQRHFACTVYVLCLSRGAYAGSDGVGVGSSGIEQAASCHVRWRELLASCRQLGVPAERVLLASHTRMPDRMDRRWPAAIVGRLLLHHVITLQLDTVVTFDRGGVSGHPNHSSLSAALDWLQRRHLVPVDCNCYRLESINILRKYCWCFDVLVVCVQFVLALVVSQRLLCRRVVFLAPPTGSVGVAMRQHVTQLLWYRRLYVLFSRYMRVNTLVSSAGYDSFADYPDDSDSDSDHTGAEVRRPLLQRQKPLDEICDEHASRNVVQWDAVVGDVRLRSGSHSP